MHGKTDQIHHDGKTIYTGMPNPFTATRYHSLVVDRASVPAVLEITAAADPWLDTLTTDMLLEHPMRNGKPLARIHGNLLQRTIYHYWFHTGEILSIRVVPFADASLLGIVDDHHLEAVAAGEPRVGHELLRQRHVLLVERQRRRLLGTDVGVGID